MNIKPLADRVVIKMTEAEQDYVIELIRDLFACKEG